MRRTVKPRRRRWMSRLRSSSKTMGRRWCLRLSSSTMSFCFLPEEVDDVGGDWGVDLWAWQLVLPDQPQEVPLDPEVGLGRERVKGSNDGTELGGASMAPG